MTSNYAKQKIAIRYWQLGAGFTAAARAMDFAEQYHVGTRKDGVTPEFAHQVGIVSYLRSLIPHMTHPDETLAIGWLHDVREDYGVADGEIRSEFGNFVADGVDYMTKEFRGVRRDDVELFKLMSTHEGASLAKPADRVNNQGSMVGVFTVKKMTEYVEETRALHLPMVKRARRRFPTQEGAYENLKMMLNSQLDLLDAVIAPR